MDNMTIIAVASIATAGLTTGIGCMCPALGEGRSVATALTALAQQPDASATITRTLFVGLALFLGAVMARFQARRGTPQTAGARPETRAGFGDKA